MGQRRVSWILEAIGSVFCRSNKY